MNYTEKYNSLMLLLFMIMWCAFFPVSVDNCQAADDNHTILIDSKHAHNYLDRGLEEGNYDYHSLFGLQDTLEYLKENNFKIIEFKDAPLSNESLNNTDTLLINLVSDNLPPFLVKEISAIKDFVRKGGNLLVIIDHSNCYHHAYKLAPLFTELGIELFNESALEQYPRTLGPGPGWIIIDHFKKHTITRNLSFISFHTGGTVDSDAAVATLSEKGWGDLWQTEPYGENAFVDGNRGNYGNFKKDENERTGKLGVIMAEKFGAGKIVVVGDQNVFGNLWLRYADNYKLMLNIFSWFSGEDNLLRYSNFINSDKPTVLFLEDYANTFFADYGGNGFYHAYAELSREFDVFTRNDIDEGYNLVVFAPVPPILGEGQINSLKKHLLQGTDIVFLSINKKLDTRSQWIFTQIVEGFEQKSRNETSDRTDIEFKSAGKIIFINNIERYNNSKIQKPTEKPNEDQKNVADEWTNLISLLTE